jgi:DNA-binding response OmpR family regulator
MPQLQVMIAEDDADIREVLQIYFETKGHVVITAENGVQALKLFQQNCPDMLLLDILLPRLDGWSVLEAIRSKSSLPVIMLSALDGTDDVIKGLALGADDYLSKPFELRELDARIEALMRRIEKPQLANNVQSGPIRIDERTKRVFVNAEEVALSPKEFALLKLLMSEYGRVFSNQEIIAAIWKDSSRAATADVKQYIHLLRHKLEQGLGGQQIIRNAKGFGYRLVWPE